MDIKTSQKDEQTDRTQNSSDHQKYDSKTVNQPTTSCEKDLSCDSSKANISLTHLDLKLPSDSNVNLKLNVKKTPTNNANSATGNPRNKTALAPGFGLMDWVRLQSSLEELPSAHTKNITLPELAKHGSHDDVWIVLRGVVYNVTPYLKFHPGGIEELMKGAGKDATSLFDKVHPWVNYQSMLRKCVVGRLVSNKLASNIPLNKTLLNRSESTFKNVSTTMQLNWKQTFNTITLSFKVKETLSIDHYTIKRTNDLIYEVIVFITKDKSEICTINFSNEVLWPPRHYRNNSLKELLIVFKKKVHDVWDTFGSSLIKKNTLTNDHIYNEYKLSKKLQLAKHISLMEFYSENYIQFVPPGRFVEFKKKILDLDICRFYTPILFDKLVLDKLMKTQPKYDCIYFIIKEYQSGIITPIITHMNEDEILEISNVIDDFVIETFYHYENWFLIAAGSGLTAMLAIIYGSLDRKNVPNFNLLNFNTTEDDIFFEEELELLKTRSKLKVNHILSTAKASWIGMKGLISTEMLADSVGSQNEHSCIFLCGPKGFLETAKDCLDKLGWQSHQIHIFKD